MECDPKQTLNMEQAISSIDSTGVIKQATVGWSNSPWLKLLFEIVGYTNTQTHMYLYPGLVASQLPHSPMCWEKGISNELLICVQLWYLSVSERWRLVSHALFHPRRITLRTAPVTAPALDSAPVRGWVRVTLISRPCPAMDTTRPDSPSAGNRVTRMMETHLLDNTASSAGTVDREHHPDGS